MTGTFTAKAKQFLRPGGRQLSVTTELPVICRESYEAMRAADCQLEVEVLINGTVSVTVSNAVDDLDCVLHQNGPGLQEAIAAMLNRRAWEAATKEAT